MRNHRREQGSALFVSMLMLVLLGVVGLAALETVNQDHQVAHFLNRRRMAFYAAEAGVAVALNTLENTGVPNLTTTLLGDMTIYPYGQPSYTLDPTVPTPIEDLGTGGASGHNLAIGGSGPSFFVQYYRVNVQGQAPSNCVLAPFIDMLQHACCLGALVLVKAVVGRLV